MKRGLFLKRIAYSVGVVVGVLGIIALCAYGLRVRAIQKPQKLLDHDIAEGLRVWNPETGIDVVRIESCRIEKQRLGFLTLGGCNVLIVTNLALNLPFPTAVVTNLAQTSGKQRTDNQKASEIFSNLFPQSVRASSVRIFGIEVNEIVGKAVVPVFRADELRTRGTRIVLNGCYVFEGGKTNLVGRAMLSFKPRPLLSWNGGQRSLENLLTMK